MIDVKIYVYFAIGLLLFMRTIVNNKINII